MGAPTSLADTPTRHGSAPARLAGVPTSLADPRMNLYGWVDEARRRPDEARWFTDEARWHTRETRRCASEARWRAHVLHGSTNQCSWAHLRGSRTGVSGSLASGRVSSERWTTLVTAKNASKGPGQSFEGEAKSVVDAPPSKVRPKRGEGDGPTLSWDTLYVRSVCTLIAALRHFSGFRSSSGPTAGGFCFPAPLRCRRG
jgi:hypothetical protein